MLLRVQGIGFNWDFSREYKGICYILYRVQGIGLNWDYMSHNLNSCGVCFFLGGGFKGDARSFDYGLSRDDFPFFRILTTLKHFEHFFRRSRNVVLENRGKLRAVLNSSF